MHATAGEVCLSCLSSSTPLTPTITVVTTLAVCAAAAALEGACAGSGVRERLREFRTPRVTPPFAVWVAIGVAYYIVCGSILYRLLRMELRSMERTVALILLALVLVINAAWNVFFFRRRDLRASVLINFPYAL